MTDKKLLSSSACTWVHLLFSIMYVWRRGRTKETEGGAMEKGYDKKGFISRICSGEDKMT